jgi:glyoxylase-like metal-dependent hydrolase (beta-lactamase superfamily II)
MTFVAIEGNKFRFDGGALFSHTPKVMWERWYAPDEQNRILQTSRSLLYQTDNGRNILFEAGMGVFLDPKLRKRYAIEEDENMLVANLAKSGVAPADVDSIIISHLHFDHIGGIFSKYEEGPLRIIFPNAKFYISKKQWDAACYPHRRDLGSYFSYVMEHIERSGRLVLVEEETHSDLDFGLRWIYSNGHTPGMLMSQVEDIIFASDLIPGMPWVNLPTTLSFDRFPEQVVDEKQALLDEAIANNYKIFFVHDPEVSCASVQVNDKGRYYGKEIPGF